MLSVAVAEQLRTYETIATSGSAPQAPDPPDRLLTRDPICYPRCSALTEEGCVRRCNR